jgi:hypothetical protein
VCGLDSSSSEWDPVMGCCESSSGPLSSIEGKEFIDELSYCLASEEGLCPMKLECYYLRRMGRMHDSERHRIYSRVYYCVSVVQGDLFKREPIARNVNAYIRGLGPFWRNSYVQYGNSLKRELYVCYNTF